VASERRTSGIVTPEAVLLEFETAGVASRGLARILDLVLQLLVLLVVLSLVGGVLAASGAEDAGLIVAVLSVCAFLVLFGYPVALETRWAGRTVGKAMLGLRVVTREGAPVRLRHAAIRAIIGSLEVIALPFISVLTTAISPANQRVGDLAAGTIVLRERSAARSAVAVRFPPPWGWGDYARTLDVSVMTGAQYRVIRSFLMRVLLLTPEARTRLGLRLANPLATAMRHRPPAQLGPELFLVCAAAAYQVRHGGAPVWPAGPAWGAPPGAAGRPPPPPGSYTGRAASTGGPAYGVPAYAAGPSSWGSGPGPADRG
jgi:uncharacterized RDD family membrane protein YckC